MEKEGQKTQISPELRDKLEKIATEKRITIISFVAPQEAVRISPITFERATIGEKEMYELEKYVKDATSKSDFSGALHIIIHTPGGELHTSYKIASFLRDKFSQISAFVPYEAASGGTLLCCAANELYIGELGNLTPIDPQVRYKNSLVSAYSFIRAVDYIKKFYGKMSPKEVPTPWQQMIEKVDPIFYDEMDSLLFTTFVYGIRLLEKSGYERNKAVKIVLALTQTKSTHDNQIMYEQAKNIGFNVKKDDKIMKVYSELVADRLKEKSTVHCINVFYSKSPSKPENDK